MVFYHNTTPSILSISAVSISPQILLSHRSYLLKPKRSLAGESGQMTPKDDSVIYMEKLIADQCIFNKAMCLVRLQRSLRLKSLKTVVNQTGRRIPLGQSNLSNQSPLSRRS
ncbi:Uncharacterized protein Rs2_04975 [Raphanus sativus]|nr:Uncharacterized protein Rs2_04975 [Raphanus sativus]